MKPFRFTLQAARTLRQRQEHFALKEYAGALLAHHQALANLHFVQCKLEAAQTRARQQRTELISASELDQLHHYCAVVAEELKACDEVVTTSLRAVNRAFQRLSAARQQREVVDKYFENRKRDYDRQLQAEEQKRLDELAQLCRSAPDLFDLTPETGRN